MPNIPREGKGKTTEGRPQLDTSGTNIQEWIIEGSLTNEQKEKKRQGQIIIPSLHDYLNAFNLSPLYKGESMITSEADITYAILYLAKHKQVINDWRGHGSVSYHGGSYFPGSGGVPSVDFDRGGRGADLGGDDPGDRGDNYGVRPEVSVKLLLRKQT